MERLARQRVDTQAHASNVAALGDECANRWCEVRRHLHNDVRVGVESFLILCEGLFVGLILVVLEHPTDTLFVPTWRRSAFVHDRLLSLRQSAHKAFGPRSYAVITKTESGSGSGE